MYTEDHREYLKRELAARVSRRPHYSQRAFARDLGLSPSSLTDFLKGRIGFSPGRITQISKQLNLSSEQREHWKDLVETKFNRDLAKRKLSLLRVKARLDAEHNALSIQEFKTISEWHYLAFLELIEINPYKYSDLKKAASELGITLKLLKESVQRLIDLKLLRTNEQGHYEVDPNTQFGNHAPSEAIRSFHLQILDKAQKALETHEMSRRFNSSTFIGLPKEKVPVIMDELKSLAYKVLEPHLQNVAPESKEELYCLSIQFFDLLQKSSESKASS